MCEPNITALRAPGKPHFSFKYSCRSLLSTNGVIRSADYFARLLPVRLNINSNISLICWTPTNEASLSMFPCIMNVVRSPRDATFWKNSKKGGQFSVACWTCLQIPCSAQYSIWLTYSRKPPRLISTAFWMCSGSVAGVLLTASSKSFRSGRLHETSNVST